MLRHGVHGMVSMCIHRWIGRRVRRENDMVELSEDDVRELVEQELVRHLTGMVYQSVCAVRGY